MFQVEDLIRAYSFDIKLIDEYIISKFDQPYPVKREMREWYSSLIYIMKSNNLNVKGHIPALQSLIEDLESFHNKLLTSNEEEKYHLLYTRARSSIEALRAHSDNESGYDIEVCLNGLYGLLMLRLMKKTISPETHEAFEFISEMIAALSSKYLDYETKVSKN